MARDTNLAAGPAPAVSGRTSKRGRANWLGWAVAALFLVGCFTFLDMKQVFDALGRLGPLQIAVVLAVFTADRVLMGVKWWVLLRLVRLRLPLLRVVRYFYAGSLAGVVLPSYVGGDILRAHWVGRDTGAPYPAYASLVMERLLGLVSAVNWAILGGVVCAVAVLPGDDLVWLGLGALGFVAANGLFALSLLDRVHAFVLHQLARHERLKPLRILHRFYEAYSGFSGNRRGLLLAMALTVLEHGVQMAFFYSIAWALQSDANPFLFIAATAVYTLLLRLPISPDGWGVGEVAAIAVFTTVGLSAELAFSVSFTSHLFILVGLIPGLVFLLLGQGRPDEAELAEIAAEQEALRRARMPSTEIEPTR